MANAAGITTHHRLFAITAMAVVTLLGTTLRGEDQDERASAVRRWVRQLNALQLADRDAAEQALVAQGPAILELLPPLDPRMPAEIRSRLTRVRRVLESAEADAVVQASTLTLSAKAIALETLLQEIHRQTGNPLQDFRRQQGQTAEAMQLDVDLNDQKFWPAVDRLLDQAQLDVYHFTGEPALALVRRSPNRRNRREGAVYAGAFRFEPTSIRAVRDLQHPAKSGLLLKLEVSWEPRLHPIVLAPLLTNFKAEDQDGGPLAVAASADSLQIPVQPGITAVELGVPLQLPPRAVTSIAKLRGTVRATVPGRTATFEFADLQKAVSAQQRQGGATVTVDAVRKNNDLWEVRLRLTYDDAAGALASHYGWYYDNRCWVVGPDGQPIEYAAVDKVLERENEVGMAYLFELPAGPSGLALKYEAPAAISQKDLTFEFRGLDLP